MDRQLYVAGNYGQILCSRPVDGHAADNDQSIDWSPSENGKEMERKYLERTARRSWTPSL